MLPFEHAAKYFVVMFLPVVNNNVMHIHLYIYIWFNVLKAPNPVRSASPPKVFLYVSSKTIMNRNTPSFRLRVQNLPHMAAMIVIWAVKTLQPSPKVVLKRCFLFSWFVGPEARSKLKGFVWYRRQQLYIMRTAVTAAATSAETTHEVLWQHLILEETCQASKYPWCSPFSFWVLSLWAKIWK